MSRRLAPAPLGLIIAVLLGLASLAAAESGYLLLCGAPKAVPFAKLPSASRLSTLCSTLASGGAQTMFADIINAAPSVLELSSFGTSWGSHGAPASVGTGLSVGKASIATFVATMAPNAPLAPETLLAVAQGLTFPTAYVVPIKNGGATGAPQGAYVLYLKNVALWNVTTDWAAGAGTTHTLFLQASASTYLVFVQDNKGAVSKYSDAVCFNPARGFSTLGGSTNDLTLTCA